MTEPTPHRPTPQFWELRDDTGGHGTQSSHWVVRAQNFAVELVEARGDVVLERNGIVDEHLLILTGAESRARVETDAGRDEVSGRAVLVMPPGDSQVTLHPGSQALRLVGRDAGEVMDRAVNSAWHERGDDRVAAPASWPLPVGGSTLRTYAVDEIPRDESRLGRIFQCNIGVVNLMYPEDGPRDDTALTPHTHDDFEQCTVQLDGDFVHHIRTPWTPRLADWRPDEHRLVASPAVTIIPARAVHTSQGVNLGRHQIIDVFSPPRVDWALRPGWVLNGHDYPVPAGLEPR